MNRREERNLGWGSFLNNISIIVTGMPGAGKDEFISVANVLGMRDFHMGNTVKLYAKRKGIEMTDTAIGQFATQERENYGRHIWAERTLESLKGTTGIVIDGLRNLEELDYMRARISDLTVVAIFANRKDRLERILKRHRVDDISDLESLVKRDNRELSWGIGTVIALSDRMIVNDGTLEEFKIKSRQLLENLLRQ